MVCFEFVVLPCRVFDGVDRVGVVGREVARVIGGFSENVDLGDFCGEIVEEFVVELLFVPMGGLHFLGKVCLLQELWMMGV